MYIDPSSLVDFVEQSQSIWEKRAKLIPLLKKLSFWIQNGTLRVPIFGPGGTGKTTLAKILAGETIKSPKYEESRQIETMKLNGDLTCTLFAVPGQEHRDHNWTRFYKDLAAGKSAGVINVVSYGYHSLQEAASYRNTGYYRSGQSKAQFLTSYLESRREREQDIIETLAPHISNAEGKLWMITLVAKQDLWWKQREKVQRHYMEGPYNSRIEAIKNKLGRQNFTHEYLSAALLSANFVSSEGEILAPTAAGYDDALALAHLQKLIEIVTNFAKDCT